MSPLHAVLVVAMLVTAGAAMAEALDRPATKVGDRWTWRSSGGPSPARTWTETVVEVLAGGRYRSRIEGEPRGPRIVEFDGPYNVVQPAPWPSLKEMQFPVAVGRAWTHSIAVTEAQTRSIAYQAVATETVKVAGGAQECLRIEGTDTTTISGVGAASPVRLWYCPAVRQVVRKETRIPTAGLVTVEVTEFKLAP